MTSLYCDVISFEPETFVVEKDENQGCGKQHSVKKVYLA